MLLFFIMFVFFVFHIQFLLKNIILGVEDVNFFMFVMHYPFDRQIAVQSLYFVLACAGGFWVGYKLAYRSDNLSVLSDKIFDFRQWRNELRVLNFMGVVIISYIGIIGGMTGFSYGPMTALRQDYGFIFELRIVLLLLLSHLLLNIPWREFLKNPKLKISRTILAVYFFGLLLFQARSAIFEFGACLIIPLLMWSGDKVQVKYLLMLSVMMIVPNVVVLGRIEIPDDPYELLDGLFSIEYTMILNQFLGAAIETGMRSKEALSFLPQFGLILPSPLRNLFDIQATNNDFILELSEYAKVYGGGFSLVAQMYTDFGWFAPIVFYLLGLLIGHTNYKASKVGRVKLIHATAPLLYSMFILSFRNDFGVLLKYSIQLFVVAAILNFLLKLRLGARSGS